MAIRNIVKEGDPILNKVCRPVTNFDDRLATLLDDMRETMIAADGVGLAGPQVGMLRRLFVVWDTTDAPEEIPENYEYKFHTHPGTAPPPEGHQHHAAQPDGILLVGHDGIGIEFVEMKGRVAHCNAYRFGHSGSSFKAI